MCVLCHLVSHTLPILLFQLAQEVTGSSRVPVWLSRLRPGLFFFIYTHTYIYILPCSVSLGLALSLIRRPKWKREERTRERALFKLWNPIAAGERKKKSACNEKQPLEFLLVKIPILLFFPLLLFLGLKTWSLAPVFMVCSFCNYHYCYCYCSIFVVFENRLLS